MYERQMHIEHAETYLQSLHRAQNPRVSHAYTAVDLGKDSPTKIVEAVVGYDSQGHIVAKTKQAKQQNDTGPDLDRRGEDRREHEHDKDRNWASPQIGATYAVPSETGIISVSEGKLEKVFSAMLKTVTQSSDFMEFAAWKRAQAYAEAANENIVQPHVCPECEMTDGHLASCPSFSKMPNRNRRSSANSTAFDRFRDSIRATRTSIDDIIAKESGAINDISGSPIPSAPPLPPSALLPTSFSRSESLAAVPKWAEASMGAHDGSASPEKAHAVERALVELNTRESGLAGISNTRAPVDAESISLSGSNHFYPSIQWTAF
jgi:hypothetical protein